MMKKAISLFLALVVCLSLCACGANEQKQQNGNENANTNTNTSTNTLPNQVDAEFIAMVCGRWQLNGGWRDLGFILEFCDDGICMINGEKLKWDAEFKNKQWLDEPKEFINVYRNDKLEYEAHISNRSDGTLALTIYARDDAGMGMVPAGTYLKYGEEAYAIVGEWKSLEGKSFVFNLDGTGKTSVGDEFSWIYYVDIGMHEITQNGGRTNYKINTENGVRSLQIEDVVFYHADDYDKVAKENGN